MADREQHHLHAGLAGAAQRPAEPVAAADGLEHQGQHPGLAALDEVVDVVGGGRDQLLSGRHGQVEPEAQPGAQQRGEDRARVGDQRDGPDREVVALGVAHGAHAAAYVPEPHAPGAHQGHPGVGRHPPELVADAVRVRAAEDHRAARTDLRRRGELVDEPGVPDAEQDQVRRVVEGVEVGNARQARDLGVRRVDQVDPLESRRPHRLGDHPAAEAAGSRARPDERDAARLEGPREGVAQAALLNPYAGGVAAGSTSCR